MFKHYIFAVMATIFLSAISVLAAPMAGYAGIMKRQETVDIFAMGTLSTLFGWQLSGSQMVSTQLSDFCFAEIPQWDAIGLSSNLIKAPMCSTSVASQNATNALPEAVVYSTNLFVMQLLAAFSGQDAFAYACDQIQYSMISPFWINANDIVNATCTAGRKQVKPEPFSGPSAPAGAVQAAQNTASILFTYIWAAGATSSSKLSGDCARAPDYVNALNAEKLNGQLIQERLCEIHEPIPTDYAQSLIKTWTTRYFITVLENISDSPTWLSWLCPNLQADQLDLIGLDGTFVQSRVCADSGSESTEHAI